MLVSVRAREIRLEGGLEIVSLAWGGDKVLYGGMTGAKNHLFFKYEPATDEYVDLGGPVTSGTQLYDKMGCLVEQKIHKALATAPCCTLLASARLTPALPAPCL